MPVGHVGKTSSLTCKGYVSRIGVVGKANHSLRATGALETFQVDVPQKIVQQRTGHHSVKALCMYECTTMDQHMAVSSILAAPMEMSLASSCEATTST